MKVEKNLPLGEPSKNFMRPSSIIECFSAFHQSKYVNGDFEQRGGIMVIAPPGMLKSTFIRLSLEDYPDALLLSDININTLTSLKNSLIDNRYTTMGFGEFEKIYQRNPATATNIEAHIKALVEEGFLRASFEDQRAQSMAARCAVIGGITPSCYSRLFTKWMENGFARRFLFCSYTLSNPEILMEAIERWKMISFGKIMAMAPGNKKIPYDVTGEENKFLREITSGQPTREAPFIISKKIFCVLKWRYNGRKARDIFSDFGESIKAKGAFLNL